MRKSIYTLLLILISGGLLAQEITSKIKQNSKVLPCEKIYLHTDKPHYSLNDTIWIKPMAPTPVGQNNGSGFSIHNGFRGNHGERDQHLFILHTGMANVQLDSIYPVKFMWTLPTMGRY